MILRFKKSYNNFTIRITVDTFSNEFYLEDALTLSFIRLPLSKVDCLYDLLKSLQLNCSKLKFSLHNMLFDKYLIMPRGSGTFLRDRIMIYHTIHIAGRNQKSKSWFAKQCYTFIILPVRLSNDTHAIAMRL